MYHKLTQPPWDQISSADKVDALAPFIKNEQFVWALRTWVGHLVQLRRGIELTDDKRDLLIALLYLVGNNADR